MVLHGYGRILDVDLSTGSIRKTEIDPGFAEGYIGGMGFGCKILYDQVGADVDPLSPGNLLIFANGPLTGTRTPCSGRTEVTTKSPLTGIIGTGNTGGLWGARLKHAGVDVLVIRGQAEKPVFLWINDDLAELRKADHLWGKDTYAASNIIQRELSASQPQHISVLSIGQAGENLVRYACPVNDEHHVAARCGAGAVMGMKRLKAVAVRGTGIVNIAHPQAFDAAVREARERLMAAEQAARMPGAPKDIRAYDLEMGCLPGKNYQTGVLPNWVETRGGAAAQKYFTKKEGTCYGCPISCFNLVEVHEGKYAGVKASRGTMPGVVFNFGGLCALDDLPAIWKCKELCQRHGMDYESAGGTIAFAMELFQRGILKKEDTGGLELTWGNAEAMVNLLERIARREGIGSVLAEGSLRAARAIGRGAEQYVMVIKGMEMTMMPDPRAGVRKGWLFGSLTNPRGGDNVKNTHFYAERYNPNWWVNQFDMFEEVKEIVYGMSPEEIMSSWKGKAMMGKWFEDLYTVCNALGICFFPAGSRLAWGPTYLTKLLNACTGRETTPQEIVRMGEKLFTLFKAYNIRQGLTRKEDAWPDRFFEEPLPEGPAQGRVVTREEVRQVLDEYYDLRGWEKKSGLPAGRKLIELGLHDVAAELQALGRLPLDP